MLWMEKLVENCAVFLEGKLNCKSLVTIVSKQKMSFNT